MVELRLENVYKRYDKKSIAVNNFNLHVHDKEFIVFVGPSGCGKSTTLRMMAGLETISEGDFYISDNRVNDIPPKDRDIAMVFQNYALYPHMDVYNNMAFSLKLRKVKKEEIDTRVKNAASILGLTPYLNRKPKALSGGQRQRVALGRAIVRDAKLFLMDEPLSNLDAKLRVQMRAEIMKLHRRLRTTTIYVTHDQTEAMTMASKIVVMMDGMIQQVGKPKEVYDAPANIFVAGFIGSPSMNFLRGQYKEGNFFMGTQRVLNLPEKMMGKLKRFDGTELVVGIRAEYLLDHLSESKNVGSLETEVEIVEMTGAETILHTTFHGSNIVAKVDADSKVKQNEKITLYLNEEHIHFFDPETEQRVIMN